MRQRALSSFLLLILFAIVLVSAPILAQSPSESELRDINERSLSFSQAGKYSEAIRLAKQFIAGIKARYGDDAPEYAVSLNNLAQLLQETNRLAEAEPLMRAALAIDERHLGASHAATAVDLSNLARLLARMNCLNEAELLYRRALRIAEATLGANHPTVSLIINNLAMLLRDTNRGSEAEPLIRRALAIDEANFGPDHPKVGIRLNNLAQLLQDTDRFGEAELLTRRALAIYQKIFGPDHPEVALSLNNLAQLLKHTKSYSEAEPLLRRALAIDEKSFGPGHPNVAADLNNLAQLFQDTHRLAEAEPLMRRVLKIDEVSSGPHHPDVARDLNNIALLLEDMNRFAEAEPLLRRALAIDEKSFGQDHPKVADDLNNLAALLEKQGHWKESVLVRVRAASIVTAVGGAVLKRNTENLRGYVRALYHENATDPANRVKGFEAAQWALQSQAADALVLMSARFSKGDQQLSKIVREQQDLWGARENAYRTLDLAIGGADAKTAGAARAHIAELEERLATNTRQLRQDFPDYAEMASPKPLSIEQSQALLAERQALLLYLDIAQYGSTSEETIVFMVTKKVAYWASIPLGFHALRERVWALRCGLDGSLWRVGEKSREWCKSVLGTETTDTQLPPFDTTAAHALYRDLFGGIADLLKGKSLLIVPSGALTQLPFEVLVTEKPDETLPLSNAYKKAEWLGQRHAITILPSVGSLKALRAAKASESAEPFAGFGNPLLTGEDGTDKSAWAKPDCSKAMPPKQSRIANLAASIASLFRSGSVNVEDLRRQPALPETADELCSVGRALGVPEGGLSKAVYLGERATVTKVKALSRSGDLARVRVVHFATHGLLAGETALFARNKAEPALLLTPPAEASEEDNGLLTASEVAQLNPNADWVVMSACNTAAGSEEGAEALSGLARAFFYAGARALLVSHWYVDSEAAVAITSGAVNAMKANPGIGRAEALRRAEAALIAKGGRFTHPSVWAPFVMVGSGEQ